MAETELKVIVKAKELAVHSFRLTTNVNRYPKKYRHSLVDRIQLKSLDIYETLLEANRIYTSMEVKNRCDTILASDGTVIRKLKNQNKRNAQRKYLKMAKLVSSGKLSQEAFYASYQSWKNHISHGNCFKLSQSMDQKINQILI